MLQPPRLNYHMKTIGIDQSLSNSDLLEHRFLQNIKKIYQYAGECDDQQQFKDILEDAMVSTSKGFTNNSPGYPMTPIPVKKNSDRKSLCIFTNILDVKNKMLSVRVRADKSKCKPIKEGTILWEMKTRRKVNSGINDHKKKSLYNWNMRHPNVLQ